MRWNVERGAKKLSPHPEAPGKAGPRRRAANAECPPSSFEAPPAQEAGVAPLHEHFLKVQLKHGDSLCGRWLGFQATAIGLGTTCWPSCRASLWRMRCLVSSTFASY